MREPCCLWLSATDRARLAALVADGTAPRNMSGGPRSSCARPTGWGRWRSCAVPARPRPASGAGRRATWKTASTDSCATRPGRRASPGWPAGWSSGWWPAPWRHRPGRRPIGPCARWRAPPASRRPRCSGSGPRTGCSRTGSAPQALPGPAFAAKLRDVVGLYVDPPAHAIVLSIDEKSQIQALDRTQPGLPMKKGRAGTMTHDYQRNGTTTLFAALNVLDGSVIGQCMQRHRHQEFIRFLNRIERDVPAGKLIHVILDNYATHKHPKVRAWLERHDRWTFHYTPTSASWLNAVEGFFAKLTRRRLRRGVFHSLVDLQAAINRYLTEHNQAPKPFVWTAEPEAILAKVKRGHQTLETIH